VRKSGGECGHQERKEEDGTISCEEEEEQIRRSEE
jgi:hypothetical protein